MFLVFLKNRLFFRAAGGLLLTLLLLAVGRWVTYAGDAPESMACYTEVRAGSAGERELYLWGESPEGLGSESAVAVRVTLSVPADWYVGEVSPCEGGAGMTVTLTMGERDADGISRQMFLLLDGYPPEAGEGEVCFLRVVLWPRGEDPAFWAEVKSGEVYRLCEDGEVESAAITVNPPPAPPLGEDISTDTTDDMSNDMPNDMPEGMPSGTPEDTSDTSDTSSGESFPQDTTYDTPSETAEAVTRPEDMTVAPDPLPAEAVYRGCQETPVQEGVYGVRLLFFGGVPPLFVEGDGMVTLTLEITRAAEVEAFTGGGVERYPGDWWICTLRGLREAGVYRLRMSLDGGEAVVTYAGGVMQGVE